MSSVRERAVAEDADDAPVPQFPHANCVAVNAIAGVLGTAFGPQSHDKLVVQQLASRSEPDNEGVPPVDDVTVTSDGATLLNALPMEHPVAPIVRRILGPERPGETDVEGKDIPDGVTSGVVLTAALLDEALGLIEMGLHPHDVRVGYARALDTALETLGAETRLLSSFADRRATERAVARTAMTGNDVGNMGETWASLAVEALDSIGRPTETSFVVRPLSTGSLSDSRLVRGAVLDRNSRASEEMPRRVDDATVLLLDGHESGGLQDPEWDERLVFDLDSPDQLDGVRDLYADRRRRLVDRYAELGVDVVVTRLGISGEFQRLLVEEGMLGVRGVSALEMKQLSRATGGTLVRNPDDVEAADLGHAGSVAEERIDPRPGRRRSRRMTVFENCDAAESVAVVLRGVTDHLAEQATTEIRKAAAAVAAARGEGRAAPGVVPGAGAIELQVAERVRAEATRVDGRSQLAVAAFADALQEVVATLVGNAGHDRLTVLGDLRAERAERDDSAVGFVLPSGTVESAAEAGVFDPAAYKRRMLVSAAEVSDLVLRVDDAIDATFTDDPAGPDDVIYDDRAEKHMDYLDENPGTRWDP